MTITGIVAEFNPFHHGHKYLLEQCQGLKIVVMSGNFVQRGEPAIIDKWTRAQMAIQNGADLVVEMPFLVSVQSADYFAEGAIDILAKLGVEKLAFGTEDLMDYNAISQVYGEKAAQMEAYLETLDDSLSYPQKTQLMWSHFTGVDFAGDTPNHILGLTYAKACACRNIKLEPIKRQGASYHSTKKDAELASASAIRKHVTDDTFIEQAMPDSSLFKQVPKVTWENYFQFLKYQITSRQNLCEIFQVNQEIESRLRAAIGSVESIEELVNKVATKRYTKARIRRILTYILVDARESVLPQAVHVLGFSEKGAKHLKEVKSQIEIVSRIGSKDWDALTQKADAIYQMGNLAIQEQNYGRIPYFDKKES